MRTIAWYHALAGEMSSADMLQWLPFINIDESTIYRYRNGQISPGADVLNAANEAFRSARSVYEVGPLNVPLWDAMWGSLSPADFKLADSAMPGGEWPASLIEELFFDDAILARIIGFRRKVVREDRVTSDLEAFAAAVRVYRACRMLGHGNPLALRVLLEGSMALPGARGLLGQLGLVEPMRAWIAAQFDSTPAQQADPTYWSPWMDSDELFFSLCQLAELRRLQVRRGLVSGLNSEHAHALVTDYDIGHIQH